MKILNLESVILKYKKIFANDYVPNWSEEVFMIKKVKNTGLQTFVVSDFKGQETLVTFYEKEQQKINQKKQRVKKLIKRKSDKMCV